MLSGTRPTGKAHLGNLAGAFLNWVKLQDSGEYKTFYFVADWHLLTTEPENSGVIKQNSIELVKDWLAVGLDPDKSVLFLQSAVIEHAELHLIFSMLVSLSRALRVPTFKEHLQDVRAGVVKDKARTSTSDIADRLKKLRTAASKNITDFVLSNPQKSTVFQKISSELSALTDKAGELIAASAGEIDFSDAPGFEAVSYGFLGYPVLQAADIAIYRPHGVPVGQDQLPHIELTREIVRRFNSMYGQVFPEPEALLTEVPKVLGSDRRKMSKRYNNGIYIADEPNEVEAKLKKFFTDPARIRKTDPGHPEECPVFTLIKAFLPDMAPEVSQGCRAGKLGCVECKARAAKGLNEFLEPMRERRKSLDEEAVVDILRRGSDQARKAAQETMAAVRKAVGTTWL